MKGVNTPVIIEQTFHASIDKVWAAITQVNKMRQWFFNNIDSFVSEVGFKTQFNVKSGTRDFLHLWELTEIISGQKIVYNWRYGGYPGDSFVTIELFEQIDAVKLRLTHQGVENFPSEIPEFKRESCLEGWNFFIKNRLKEFLNGLE